LEICFSTFYGQLLVIFFAIRRQVIRSKNPSKDPANQGSQTDLKNKLCLGALTETIFPA
ncbi:unnamed protein product, partial [Musa banksii]